MALPLVFGAAAISGVVYGAYVGVKDYITGDEAVIATDPKGNIVDMIRRPVVVDESGNTHRRSVYYVDSGENFTDKINAKNVAVVGGLALLFAGAYRLVKGGK